MDKPVFISSDFLDSTVYESFSEKFVIFVNIFTLNGLTLPSPYCMLTEGVKW